VTDRSAALRLGAVFAAALVVAWGAAELAGRWATAPRPTVPALGSADLRFAFVSAEVDALGNGTAPWPVYRALSPGLRAAAVGAESGASGVVARYRRGWIAWAGAPHDPAAPWRLLAPSETGAQPELPSTLAPAATPADGSFAIVLRPREIFALAAGAFDPIALRGVPEQAVGTSEGRGGTLRERWELDCPNGCLLELLDRNGAGEAAARGWGSLPPDADAFGWFLLDPEADLGGRAGDVSPTLAAVERVFDLPLRDALARALEGPVVYALRDPRDDGIPRVIAAIDLRRPEEARDVLDRAFALGILAEALEVARYRGTAIGTWRPKAGAPGSLTLAVDDDVLLAALRPEDVREAIDRRRRGGRAGPPARFDSLGRGSWKSWSRSPFVAAGWEEILSGRPSRGGPLPFETAAVALREGDRWVVRSEGSAPALAAEPLVPSARAALRALRRER
jgi:hypothetical protein